MDEFNHFEEIYQHTDEAINKLVRRTAFAIERGAKKRAPVKTGFMRNSIYTRTEKDSGFGKSSKSASRRNKNATLFPEVLAPGHNQAYVAVGAEYAIYLEFGTHRMGARPFFYPSVEVVRPKYLQALQRLMDRLKAIEIQIDATIAGDLPEAP